MTSLAEGSRHIKKAFITLCSDTSKLRNFQVSSDLATIDVLRDIRLSLLCLFWYAFCVYAYAHARTLNYEIAREYILYSAWASRCRF